MQDGESKMAAVKKEYRNFMSYDVIFLFSGPQRKQFWEVYFPIYSKMFNPYELKIHP